MHELRSASQLPDLTGHSAIVTGATSGIGLATATALASRGAQITLAVRDLEKGRAAAAAIGHGAEARHLDLSSLGSVRAFAAATDRPIDYLINNAGAMTSERRITVDGFESQFGVNHLGHFALTNLLIAQVTRRVVTVTSSLHRSATVDFDDLQWQRRAYKPFGAYGQSKLANMAFTIELQRLLGATGSGVLAEASDPGYVASGFRMSSGNALVDRGLALSTHLLGQSPTGGALSTLLAVAGDLAGGSLTAPSRLGIRGPARPVAPSEQALDPGFARRLWTVSEELTGTRFPVAGAPAPH